MSGDWLRQQFSLDGQVAVVTGGGGALGGAMAHGLAQAGARVALVGRRQQRVEDAAAEIAATGAEAIGLSADVHDRAQLASVRDAILARWGRIDILINAAGGNVPGATLAPGASFFDLPIEAFHEVVDLNLLGTVLPSQVFGAVMAAIRTRLDRQYLVDDRHARDHPSRRIFGGEGGDRQLHPLAGD